MLNFKDHHQWRNWLERNHAAETEAWLILHKKKYAGQGLALDDAVKEALCFGWIDSTLNTLDEKRYVLRFSPRKADSVWSMSNIRRVEELAAVGKMTGAGQQKVREAKENGQWQAAVRREQVDIVPAELESALRQHEGALSSYQALPDSHKKRYIYWLQSAKRADTKQRRIQKIIEDVLSS